MLLTRYRYRILAGSRSAKTFAGPMSRQDCDADAELAAFRGGTIGPQKFWQQVDANFSAGRIKMVLV